MAKIRDNQVKHIASTPGTIEDFLDLPTQVIADLVQEKGKPQVGIFVPDGNRRLVLAETNLQAGSEEFLTQVALTQTTYGLGTLKVFFGHGLPTLFAPLLSRSVLARGNSYYRLTALTTLNIMLNSDSWLEFYETWNVQVRVYGDLAVLDQVGCESLLQSMERIQRITQTNPTHTLFLGIGGEPWVGSDVAQATAHFYEKNHREPSRDELIEFLYGQIVSPADFCIMGSKLAGLGALPALICGRDTQMYYLPVPGVIGLTQHTYRAILYDLLYLRDGPVGERCYALSPGEREQLRLWYADHADTVIGLGRRIGSVWVPDDPNWMR